VSCNGASPAVPAGAYFRVICRECLNRALTRCGLHFQLFAVAGVLIIPLLEAYVPLYTDENLFRVEDEDQRTARMAAVKRRI
jgi:hypothetical protein